MVIDKINTIFTKIMSPINKLPSFIRTVVLSFVIYEFYNLVIPFSIQFITSISSNNELYSFYSFLCRIPILIPIYMIFQMIIVFIANKTQLNIYYPIEELSFKAIIIGSPILNILFISIICEIARRFVKIEKFYIILFTYIGLELLTIFIVYILVFDAI